MFGMKKIFKYIKVSGVVLSTQDNFQQVIIRDDVGQELKFEEIIISRNLRDEFEIGKPMIFYFMRAKSGRKMIGALYALEKNRIKIYQEEDAIAICKALASQLSQRMVFPRDDKLRFVYQIVCLGIAASIFTTIAQLFQSSKLNVV